MVKARERSTLVTICITSNKKIWVSVHYPSYYYARLLNDARSRTQLSQHSRVNSIYYNQKSTRTSPTSNTLFRIYSCEQKAVKIFVLNIQSAALSWVTRHCEWHLGPLVAMAYSSSKLSKRATRSHNAIGISHLSSIRLHVLPFENRRDMLNCNIPSHYRCKCLMQRIFSWPPARLVCRGRKITEYNSPSWVERCTHTYMLQV